MRAAIYPGSFDPVTNGHLSLIERSLRIFDHLTVAVASNPRKQALFSVPERIELLEASLQEILPSHGTVGAGSEQARARVKVESFEGLLVHYVKQKGANVIVRGLRAVSDFEYEFQMANMNRHLERSIETVFMMTGEESFYISSNFVREVAMLGGSVKGMVPPAVEAKLTQRFKVETR